MNKADNEAGNAAIDSLLNYETVKVRTNPHPALDVQKMDQICVYLVKNVHIFCQRNNF